MDPINMEKLLLWQSQLDTARREIEELRREIAARDDDAVRLRATVERLRSLLHGAPVICPECDGQSDDSEEFNCPRCANQGYVPFGGEP